MAKKYYWLKLPEDFFRNKAIKKLRRIAGGDTYVIIYLKMLLASLKGEGKIFLDGVEDSTAEEIALEIDEDAENVKITLCFLERAGLLVETSSNVELTQLLDMIGVETAAAGRMRDMRERQKSIGERNNVTTKRNNVTRECNNVTAQLQPVTNCYTEIEIEKEIEKEIEIETEIDKSTGTKRKRFTPPTLEEVQAYCLERNNHVDAIKWHDYYTANDWHVGRNKMRDWRAAVRTWERNGYDKANDDRLAWIDNANL